jgi:hypothetical protein
MCQLGTEHAEQRQLGHLNDRHVGVDPRDEERRHHPMRFQTQAGRCARSIPLRYAFITAS